MKIIVITTALILLIFYVITAMEPNESYQVLDGDTMAAMQRSVLIKRVLWVFIILMQLFLCYYVYKSIPKYLSKYRIRLKLFLLVVTCTTILSMIILFIALSSTWV
jgi:hypothetical protein